ncbi:hypothetical protein M9458_021712, partial [Cirrhinus mrigala]
MVKDQHKPAKDQHKPAKDQLKQHQNISNQHPSIKTYLPGLVLGNGVRVRDGDFSYIVPPFDADKSFY